MVHRTGTGCRHRSGALDRGEGRIPCRLDTRFDPAVRRHHAADRQDQAEAKALEPPDLVLDKLVKEIGNSIYGKIAQAVASTRIIKDDIERRRVFNTMFDVTEQMGPSAITNAPMAAYCTGLVRALLTETLGRLPGGMWVGTATTDGMLIAGGIGKIDQSGPMAMAFKAVRERITPGDDTIWELKHSIPGALVTKTRGTYTVAPEGWNEGVVLAKAGYMTPEEAMRLSEIEQCRIWIERFRMRNFETKMVSKSLTSLRHNTCSRWTCNR